ncbi:MAG: hypothetical protein ACRDO2_07030, partial [Nocardioidaceae bacterium]
MKILLASPIDPATVRELHEAYDVRQTPGPKPEQLRQAIADRHTVILRSGVQLTADVMAGGPD